MGRELMRVPLTFDWPLHMPWKGYCCPYSPTECRACRPDGERHGDGMSPEGRAMFVSLYDHGWTGQRLTQQDLDGIMVEDAFLLDGYTHRPTGKGLAPIKPAPPLTPDAVNAWLSRQDHVLWDNFRSLAWALTGIRCAAAGVNHLCRWCKGHGTIWCSEEFEQLADNWQKIDPPKGKGWQLWETVSQGSPITPVFATPQDLAIWLVDNDRSATQFMTYDKWLAFFRKGGHAPSAVDTGDGRGYRSGAEFVAEMEEDHA